MTSKELTQPAPQIPLLPEHDEKPVIEPVTQAFIERVRRQRTFLDVWNYAQTLSTLSNKAICLDLKLDASHLTRIQQGRASPPADERFNQYLDIVQTEAPLIWWVEKRGYDWLSLRRHEDDKDRKIRELEAENAQLKRDREVGIETARQIIAGRGR